MTFSHKQRTIAAFNTSTQTLFPSANILRKTCYSRSNGTTSDVFACFVTTKFYYVPCLPIMSPNAFSSMFSHTIGPALSVESLPCKYTIWVHVNLTLSLNSSGLSLITWCKMKPV